jgi:secreted PhoX family phosphatase
VFVVIEDRGESMFTTGTQRRRALVGALMALGIALGFMAGVTTSRARSEQPRDFGLSTERRLRTESEDLFGFGRPVPASATTPSSTLPGEQAVDVAQGLKVKLVTDKVADNADQIVLWPNDSKPTYAFMCNEINGAAAGAPTTFQRVRLADGQITNMISGLVACDPARRTPWGTLLIGEEAGAAGRVWEVLDPVNVSGVTVNRAAGTSSDPRVVSRDALGRVSFEGLAILIDGTTYYGDELRPSAGKPGGGIYKFVPTTKRAANAGPITSLDQSPFAAGNVYVARLGAGASFGQGANLGAGIWVGPLTGNLAAAALAAGGYTGYFRPEDMDIDPIAAANGKLRFCWTNTGADAAANWGEVLCMTDDAAATATTGSNPTVSLFVTGSPSIRMPDNLAFQPKTGILYLLMDASTSADSAFGNNDVWACLPDGADQDVLTDGCVRVMTLKDGNAEFTGIQFLADGRSFYINLQHRTQTGRAVQGTTDMIKVSGIQVGGEDDHGDDN